ncbi:hypothetical protein HHE03_07790 [Helicobacter heilmannii]|nr:hypothetical protein HHE03_07790 [Helicobacter heilmannii]
MAVLPLKLGGGGGGGGAGGVFLKGFLQTPCFGVCLFKHFPGPQDKGEFGWRLFL